MHLGWNISNIRISCKWEDQSIFSFLSWPGTFWCNFYSNTELINSLDFWSKRKQVSMQFIDINGYCVRLLCTVPVRQVRSNYSPPRQACSYHITSPNWPWWGPIICSRSLYSSYSPGGLWRRKQYLWALLWEFTTEGAFAHFQADLCCTRGNKTTLVGGDIQRESQLL